MPANLELLLLLHTDGNRRLHSACNPTSDARLTIHHRDDSIEATSVVPQNQHFSKKNKPITAHWLQCFRVLRTPASFCPTKSLTRTRAENEKEEMNTSSAAHSTTHQSSLNKHFLETREMRAADLTFCFQFALNKSRLKH